MASGELGEVAASKEGAGQQVAITPSERGNGGTVGRIIAGAGVVGNWIERTVEVAVVLVLLAELGMVFTNIVLRTLFSVSYDWEQEISPIALVFLTFVGGALTYRRGGHMRVHAGIQALPVRAPVRRSSSRCGCLRRLSGPDSTVLGTAGSGR